MDSILIVFFGQDLRDFLGLFVVFLSFRMKLRKFNPLNGGKDQPVHTPYLFGQLLVACFTHSSRRHIIASPQAIVFGQFLPPSSRWYMAMVRQAKKLTKRNIQSIL